MLISTKGRYALRVMADLARNGGEEYVVLMDIAERQNISEKYLEGIVAALSRCGFLQTQRGRGGGLSGERHARRPYKRQYCRKIDRFREITRREKAPWKKPIDNICL